MPEHNAFDDLKRSHEEEYFQRHERELLARMRNRAALGAAAGTDDTTILDALSGLGYDHDTIKLLYLVPVLQTAWSDGSIAPRERDAILELARVRGIEPGTGAHARLEEMLARPPAREFFERTMEVLRALLIALPEDQRETDAKDIVAYCTRVAEASGGLLGALGIGGRLSEPEREMIARVAETLRQRQTE